MKELQVIQPDRIVLMERIQAKMDRLIQDAMAEWSRLYAQKMALEQPPAPRKAAELVMPAQWRRG